MRSGANTASAMPCRRILIEVETGRAVGEVHVDDHRLNLEIARDRPADIVRDSRGPDAALGADKGDDPAERLCAFTRIEPGHGADEIQNAERHHEIFADPARHQFAIERDVVRAADDNDLRARVAELRELVEFRVQLRAIRPDFEHDQIGRRRGAIGFDRSRRAAHVNLDMRLVHAPVARRVGHDAGEIGCLAKGLHRDARNNRDLLMLRRAARCWRQFVVDHVPLASDRTNAAILGRPIRRRVGALADIADRAHAR